MSGRNALMLCGVYWETVDCEFEVAIFSFLDVIIKKEEGAIAVDKNELKENVKPSTSKSARRRS